MNSGSLLLLAVGISGVACSGNAVDPRMNPCEIARRIRPSPAFSSVAEEADIAARALPGGFGGLYLDLDLGTGPRVVAFLKDLSNTESVRVDLRRLLLCDGAYPGWAAELMQGALDAIAFRQGQYSGTELLAYLRSIQSLQSDPAVWAVALDPEANRVWVGLLDATELGRIRQAVETRQVPSGAVSFEVPPGASGTEPFEILNAPITITNRSDPFGTLFFALRVRYTNRGRASRYPDWCVDPDPERLTAYFLATIQQWTGAEWRDVRIPLCALVLLAPREVGPGESVTDSVPVASSRRVNTRPYWRTARITGTYRLVGKVYTATPPSPGNLASVEEQISEPFRLTSTLPF